MFFLPTEKELGKIIKDGLHEDQEMDAGQMLAEIDLPKLSKYVLTELNRIADQQEKRLP